MRKIAYAMLILLMLFAFVSCRPDITEKVELDDIQTYEALFDAWWFKMNQNYVFWNLDSPGSEWDDVRSEYLPIFRSYGDIANSDIETQDAVIGDFYDIISDLSDMHYSMSISLPDKECFMATGLISILSRLGLEPEVAKDLVINRTYSSNHTVQSSAFYNEGTKMVMEKVFGISLGDGIVTRSFGTETAREGKLGQYFVKAGYVSSSELVMLAGLTEDNILYFSFSEFSISSCLAEGSPVRDALIDLLDSAFLLIPQKKLNGFILDLRGNGGGDVVDLQLLWQFISDTPTVVAESRYKNEGSRLSYTSWQPATIQPSDDISGVFDKPIVLLVNNRTASCAEFSTMFFKALNDKHGADVTIMGDQTLGATGMIYDISDNLFDSGTFTLGDFIKTTTTPFLQNRMYDGTFVEGKGIVPDEIVPFEYDKFVSGEDTRLNRAFSLIRGQ